MERHKKHNRMIIKKTKRATLAGNKKGRHEDEDFVRNRKARQRKRMSGRERKKRLLIFLNGERVKGAGCKKQQPQFPHCPQLIYLVPAAGHKKLNVLWFLRRCP